MITGGDAWAEALAARQKQPLWVLEIPEYTSTYFDQVLQEDQSLDYPSLVLCSFSPTSLITSPDLLGFIIPSMQVPKGASQKIDELEGHSSISSLEITAIDKTGNLRLLASAGSITAGRIAKLRLGFPGLDLADFVVMHTGRITSITRDSSGLYTISINDLLMDLVTDAFVNGGPDAWLSGDPANPFPTSFPALLDNAIPVSTDNPRYISGNPMDILLAVMQNELGVGQDAPPLLSANLGIGSGTGVAGFTINPDWTIYDGVDPGTLISPNPYLDVAGVLAFRDADFSGDRMEFIITAPQNGKTWIQDEILKPLGLYWITGADGKLRLKSMKHPTSRPSGFEMFRNTIIGIPETDHWPVVNILQASLPLRADGSTDVYPIPFVQQTSINTFKATFVQSVDSQGLRLGLGGYQKLFLLANRIFNRHAFATPVYKIRAFFQHVNLELGDFIGFEHSLVPDLMSGAAGITEPILCEIVSRQPNYAAGYIDFEAIDTRFIQLPTSSYLIASRASAIPDWSDADEITQRETYMYVSDDSGQMSTPSAAGNTIS